MPSDPPRAARPASSAARAATREPADTDTPASGAARTPSDAAAPASRATRTPASRATRTPAGSGARPGWVKPTAADLAAAADKTLPDLIAPGLRVLFCGINPSLYSAATGCHFARPGNRFWPALHLSGFTPRLMHPSEQGELLGYGLGVTNLAARATARADELSAEELLAGAAVLTAKVAEYRPSWLAVVGVTAYRTAFTRPRAHIGRQEDTVAGAPVWVLPNPSGLNAHFDLERLAAEFARLRHYPGGDRT